MGLTKRSGVEQMVARLTHYQQVAGSNPAAASMAASEEESEAIDVGPLDADQIRTLACDAIMQLATYAKALNVDNDSVTWLLDMLKEEINV